MTTWLVRLHDHDERLLHALVRRRRSLLDTALRHATHLGDAATVIALAGILAAGAVPALTAAGRHAALLLALSHLLVQLVKRSVSRPRPSLPPGIESLVEAPDRFSFPSGHASAALAVALPLAAAASSVVGVCILALAALVGLSRCYLGVHYPGDVVVAWILTLASALALEPLVPLLGAL